ncbi:MAG: DUF1304 domain-containing protein [Betaproteobacteria bacterium]|nr:DUF1304 domain-containing protein [Betaproteobacteria bacterium]
MMPTLRLVGDRRVADTEGGSTFRQGQIVKFLEIALVLLVALEHLYFLYLEMFLWTTPKGLRIFGNTAEKADASRILAANQGLYNGFLAAGLLWGLVYPGVAGSHIQMFFLSCVIVAGIYGGLTAKRTILYLQGGPALLALLVLLAE